ncbi:hypothetical protein EIN_046390 [Entamoeba invadens IP1]|uniref:Uncharacterized protein n=2 Tax=Entamoeba invadens TaxID=33085 RepID=A0A0A1UDJ1_ENTIV|nr:hypothetical protein EIN_046390 [Entamoeba invadens IP1]ELP94396.1 hypothetical protein EIN_046390 [Entamoeba invadens IP1]BAN41063.1 hypothetical protein [Entamoeba invadens]|eukprot:XP_004261167.1 hypothetical protein EIN_046390 [Entamoeba invadens IP1]
MDKIQRGIVDLVSIAVNPEPFFEPKLDKIESSVDGFIGIVSNNQLYLNSLANERVTGYTNLLITCVCLISSIILLSTKTHGFYQFIRKFLMILFHFTMAFGSVFGFTVHAFTINAQILSGLWLALYASLIFALMFLFFQAFWEVSALTFIIMLPFVLLGAYFDLILCWTYDLFICIGAFAVVFGFFMGIIHFSRSLKSGAHFCMFVSDLIALCGVAVQATHFRVGDWDKNAFFHLAVAIFILVSSISLSVILKKERTSRRAKSD